ncbi:cytochrome P450 [Xylariaceae sp. FL0016]|nr:cytochrome P450 [Xylariaceae sp. FL0016]
MSPPSQAHDAKSLLHRARRRYFLAMGILMMISAAYAFDISYLKPCLNIMPPRVNAVIVLLLTAWIHFSLHADYSNCSKMVRHGCEPIPIYENNLFGVRFLMETAENLKKHTLLEHRQHLLNTLGHTLKQRQFPDNFETITTDDPENIKTILATKFEDWNIPKIRIESFLPVLGRHSIFTTNGPEWQHTRAVIRPAFVRDQISDLACLDRHITALIAALPKDGSPVDLQAMFSMLTTDSITDFMLGHSIDMLGRAPADGMKFGNYFDAAMQKIAYRARLGWLTLLFPDKELNGYTAFMDAYVDKYVAELRASRSRGTDDRKSYVFLNELLDSGEPDHVIRAHLMSIFLAGRDTTTSALTYMFYQFSLNPSITNKLRSEIAALGHPDPTWQDLRNMQYLTHIVKEALRLSPPVPSNQRAAIRDTILPTGGGPLGTSPVFVPRGTNCRYQVWSMQRRPDIYGPDADVFRPERWADPNLRVAYEYLPFNAGPRICIGQQFALAQLAMVAFRLLQAFESIERKDDRPATQRLGLNLSMVHGCWVSMKPAADA